MPVNKQSNIAVVPVKKPRRVVLRRNLKPTVAQQVTSTVKQAKQVPSQRIPTVKRRGK
jgi:hypothetical protein